MSQLPDIVARREGAVTLRDNNIRRAMDTSRDGLLEPTSGGTVVLAKENELLAAREAITIERELAINVSRMAFGGLAESVVFSEAGDMHWGLIGQAFGVPPSHIVDDDGERLYAGFTRARISASCPLRDFREDDVLRVTGSLERVASTAFFSQICMTASCGRRIDVCLLSTFMRRGPLGNRDLTRSTPRLTGPEASPLSGRALEFVRERKLQGLRTRQATGSSLAETPLYKTPYEVHDLSDINGLGLMYFAAFPRIHDSCERNYFNGGRLPGRRRGDWLRLSATLSRDISYFANCDAGDNILFVLNEVTETCDRTVRMTSSFHRTDDGIKMAEITTIKSILD